VKNTVWFLHFFYEFYTKGLKANRLNTNIFIANYLSGSSPKYFRINAGIDGPPGKLEFDDLVCNQQDGISAIDRSVNYGDGCFTTMYSEGQNVFVLDKHLVRLEQDAKRLGIKFCLETLQYYLNQACTNLLKSDTPASVVKVLISRGSGGRGYEPPEFPKPQIIISFYPTAKLVPRVSASSSYKKTVKIAEMRLSIQPLLAGIKHLNRLEQVLAKQELQLQDCDDLLICDQANNLVEATASNIFCLKNGVWITPSLVDCGVSGVMRNSVLEFMQMNEIPHDIQTMCIQDILEASAVFLCNSIKFIMPISSIYAQNKTVEYDVSPSFDTLDKVYKWMNEQVRYTSEAAL
jgi:4-amino-4-deoxychorismate lyase